MQSEKSKLTQMFESEIWLYLDGQLEKDRIIFWDEQIAKSAELRNILNETKKIINIYASDTLNDIDNPLFENMLNKATQKKSGFKTTLKRILLSDNEKEPGINPQKIAFGVLLSIAAFVMLMISDKPNNIKDISSDVLDWDGISLTKTMDEIEGGIFLIEDDKMKEYMLYKLENDKWKRDIYSIHNDIEKLISETEKRSM